jgi:hypothetical protein
MEDKQYYERAYAVALKYRVGFVTSPEWQAGYMVKSMPTGMGEEAVFGRGATREEALDEAEKLFEAVHQYKEKRGIGPSKIAKATGYPVNAIRSALRFMRKKS